MVRASWKSLLARKGRLVMSTFAIVLGVAFVAGSLIFSDTLGRSFTSIFASTVGDVVVRPVGGTTADGSTSAITLPASILDRLRSVEGAARADGNVSTTGVYVVGRDDKVVGGGGPPAFGGSYSTAPAGHGIVGLHVVTGRAPSGPGEVVLDRRTAAKGGYAVGDEVPLVTSGTPSSLRARLVGLLDFGEQGSLNGATVADFDTATAQRLFLGGADAFNDVWVTAAPGVSQDRLRARVAEVLPTGVEAVTGDEAARQNAADLQDALSFITTFLLVFAGISLVVGAFLIVNTFSILVAQRSRELALLRALGASGGQVLRSVLLEALVLGVLGSTIGAALGVGLAWLIEQVFGRFGLDLSGSPLILAPRTFLAAYGVGVVVTVVAALGPALRTTRIPPVAALRDDVALPQGTLTRRLVGGLVLVAGGLAALAAGLYADASGWFVAGGVLGVLVGVAAASPVLSRPFLRLARVVSARLFGTIGLLAGENSLRNPRRTTGTASALMIGLTLCCTMAIAGSSAKASVDQTVRDTLTGDLVVSNVFGQGFSPRIADQAERTEGVASVTRLRYAAARQGSRTLRLVGLDPATLSVGLSLALASGSLADLGPATVVVSQQLADDQGLAAGDTLRLQVPRGVRSLRVVGVLGQNALLQGADVGTTLEGLVADGYQPVDNVVFVRTTPDADVATVRDRLLAATADLPTVTVKDQEGLVAEQLDTIDQLLLLIYGLLALSLLIAVLGIVNTLGLSVLERTREVGLLRAVGVSRVQLWRMVTLESVVIALLGTVIGVVLGTGFGVALMYDLRSQGLEVISVPWSQFAWFILAALVVGVLAAVLPSVRAARLDVLRAMGSE